MANKFKANVNEDLIPNLRQAVQDKVEEATILVHNKLQSKLRRGSRSGAFYRVPGTSRIYQASAPGEPPANRTGSLADSYDFEIHTMRGLVGTPDPRGRRLELGTAAIRPRPHLRPVAFENEQEIRSIFRRGVRL